MSYKKLTAVPKTAEEIVEVKGCVAFSWYIEGDDDWIYYAKGMNDIALKKERIQLKLFDSNKYDYIDNKKWTWRKEWLKDIRAEVDWSKVPVNTPVVVKKPSGKWEVQHFKKYKGKCDLIEVWQDGKTSYTTNSTDEYYVDNVKLISDEFKGRIL